MIYIYRYRYNNDIHDIHDIITWDLFFGKIQFPEHLDGKLIKLTIFWKRFWGYCSAVYAGNSRDNWTHKGIIDFMRIQQWCLRWLRNMGVVLQMDPPRDFHRLSAQQAWWEATPRIRRQTCSFHGRPQDGRDCLDACPCQPIQFQFTASHRVTVVSVLDGYVIGMTHLWLLFIAGKIHMLVCWLFQSTFSSIIASS